MLPWPDPADPADLPPLRVRNLGRMPYQEALAVQYATRDAVRGARAPDTLLLAEHDPVMTLGRRGDRRSIRIPTDLERRGIKIVATERGGDVTYHGPGQLVVYPVLDLHRFQTDLRWYVGQLEAVVIQLLTRYGIRARCDPERHGVFTTRGKIASVGMHVSRWVTMHGVAVNVNPNMANWALIAPCGDGTVAAASMAQHLTEVPALDMLSRQFVQVFAEQFHVTPQPMVHDSGALGGVGKGDRDWRYVPAGPGDSGRSRRSAGGRGGSRPGDAARPDVARR